MATAVSIGASVGIVTSDYDDRTSDDLMRDADLALYAAKAAGKGCFRFFAPEMHEAARERQRMESDLRVALEKGQLRVVFQPSVDASSEAVCGFEALIRWDHPEHGPVSPAQFIPLAEEIGLINEIGEWVLRTACAEAAKWPEQVSIAVNLSPVQFKVPSLPSTVRAILGETGLEAHRLELEITERRVPQQRRARPRDDLQSEEDRVEARSGRLRYGLFQRSAICFGSRSTRSRSISRSCAVRPIPKAATPR